MRRARVQCSMIGRSGEAPLSVCCSPPMPPAAMTSATKADALRLQHVACDSPSVLPTVPVVDAHIMHAGDICVPLEVSVPCGLSNARKSLRVGVARHGRRQRRFHFHARTAVHGGRARARRRATGARLQRAYEAPRVLQAAFEPSKLRIQLQVGFQVVGQHGNSVQPYSFKTLSTCSGLIEKSLEFCAATTDMNNFCQR